MNSGIIVCTKSGVSLQKLFLFSFGFQKFLPRTQKHCPGNVKFTISVATQLKIQDSGYMMILPENIGIMKIPVTEHRFSPVWSNIKIRIQKVQIQAVKLFFRRSMEEGAVHDRRCIYGQLVELSQGFTVFLHIGKGSQIFVFSYNHREPLPGKLRGYIKRDRVGAGIQHRRNRKRRDCLQHVHFVLNCRTLLTGGLDIGSARIPLIQTLYMEHIIPRRRVTQYLQRLKGMIEKGIGITSLPPVRLFAMPP